MMWPTAAQIGAGRGGIDHGEIAKAAGGDIPGRGDICCGVTRCNIYCSFVSRGTEKSRKLISGVLKALEQEIHARRGMIQPTGFEPLHPPGTPTTLSVKNGAGCFKTSPFGL